MTVLSKMEIYSMLPIVRLLQAATLSSILIFSTSWRHASAVHKQFAIAEIVSALQLQGVRLDHLQKQPIDDVPGSPPATEKQAWGFTIHGTTSGIGRILLFANATALSTKDQWYKRVGATVVVGNNTIIWLDKATPRKVLLACQRALNRLK